MAVYINLSKVICVTLLLVILNTVAAARVTDGRYRLPPYDEVVAELTKWQEQCPDRLKIETLGKSSEGRPILLCHITDFNMPEDNKQRVLFCSAHTAEVTGPLQILYTMRWLLGDSDKLQTWGYMY